MRATLASVNADDEDRRQRIEQTRREAADRMRAITLAAIQAATGEAFDPDETRVLTTLETIKACRAIVMFLREVEHHGGTLTTWRERIETIVDFTTGTLRG